MVNQQPLTARCHICKCELNTADPTTRDCGGDCLLCMAEAGDPDCIQAIYEVDRTFDLVRDERVWKVKRSLS